MEKTPKEETAQGPIYVAPPEYIIIWKLLFFREGGSEKHIRDIARILEVSAAQIDWSYLKEEVENFGLGPIWTVHFKENSRPR